MKKTLLFLSFCILVFSFFNFYQKKEIPKESMQQAQIIDNQNIAVVELFTSEGCSSCPPADEVLSELAEKVTIFPLGFHVTYWNRLGWKDEFSQKIFDERQYAYGEKFRLSSVYTPQLIVNGAEEMVGSKRANVLKSIDNQLKNVNSVDFSLSKKIENDKVIIQFSSNNTNKNVVLNIALTESKIVTQVKNGENGGRTLYHDNVVRAFQTVALDETGSVTFDLVKGKNLENYSIVGYVQEKGLGKILNAKRLFFEIKN
jgi:hypothetical protein